MKINNHKVKSLALLSLIGSISAKKGNQTGINLNSLPQMETNLTSAKITKKGDPWQNVLVAGSQISIAGREPDEKNKTFLNGCTNGFAIVNSNTSECIYGNDYGGFLTTSICHFRPTTLDQQPPVTRWNSSMSLGNIYYQLPLSGQWPFNYFPWNGEYLYISADLSNIKLLPFVPKTTEEGTKDLLPVVSLGNPTVPGLEVCVYGAFSGYRCGHIIEIGANVTFNAVEMGGTVFLYNLNKVNLGAITNGLTIWDSGAPVYSEIQIGERTLAEALGHVSWIDNNDYQNQFFYYVPLEHALDMIKGYDSCNYNLLTYNENNAQEYDQLIAQMEIPVKK